LKTFIYLTVGTGIGGGASVEGKIPHGLLHPEMMHIPLAHNKTKDPFEFACPFHQGYWKSLRCAGRIGVCQTSRPAKLAK
jgi:fructokinase